MMTSDVFSIMAKTKAGKSDHLVLVQLRNCLVSGSIVIHVIIIFNANSQFSPDKPIEAFFSPYRMGVTDSLAIQICGQHIVFVNGFINCRSLEWLFRCLSNCSQRCAKCQVCNHWMTKTQQSSHSGKLCWGSLSYVPCPCHCMGTFGKSGELGTKFVKNLLAQEE